MDGRVSLALFLRYWKEGVMVLLVLTVVGFCRARDRAVGDRRVAQDRAHVADSTLKVIAQLKLRAETTYIHNTKRLVVHTARVDTLRQTVLQHLHDTTVVKEYVVATDSALKACSDVRQSCDERHRLDALEIAQWKTKAQTAPAAQPRQHWGLGSTLGPCLSFDGKAVHACPLSLNVGFTYRW